LLRIESLSIAFRTRTGQRAKVVDDISFHLGENTCLGIVGESGCGKTTVAKAILKILPPNAEITNGRILFKGRDLVPLSYNEMRRIRWKEISMITQDALNSLNPVHRVEDQIVEALTTHEALSRREASQRAGGLFELVGIERKRLKDFPHQFSGGMKQRAIIAMALALNPALILADEPTTALDVIVQDSILQKMDQLQKTFKNSMILITHDVSIVAENCNWVLVMYAGKIMEYGRTETLLTRPYHPYTLGLQNAFPSIVGGLKHLISIPGAPPNPIQPPSGCRFHERCPFCTDRCREEEPPLLGVEDEHLSSCHFPDRIDEFRKLAGRVEVWQRMEGRPDQDAP